MQLRWLDTSPPPRVIRDNGGWTTEVNLLGCNGKWEKDGGLEEKCNFWFDLLGLSEGEREFSFYHIHLNITIKAMECQ